MPFLIALIIAVAILAVGAGITAIGVAWLERIHPPAGRFVPAAGGRLHVVDLSPPCAAAGPPVVLLHGASGNLEDQRLTLGHALAARRRVILIDRPGHGFSDRPGGRGDASPGRQAALVAQALSELGIERAIILGHSWSGALAAALALDFPQRVAGLVLLSPVTHPWPGGISWYNTLASTRVVGPLFAHTLALPLGLLMIGSGIAGVFVPQRPPPEYARRSAARLVLRPAEFTANAQDIAALKAFVTAQVPRYRAIAAPTVIISGDRDTVVSVNLHARVVAALVPDAELVLLEGIGHMPQHAAAQAIVKAIDELEARIANGA
ncbi:MAG TPA: alpha/beta hydrolase [Xanthobacteraceae bacterium]|nr:alpha/beta hydrolase [Xanthobacteraceae bacterium]